MPAVQLANVSRLDVALLLRRYGIQLELVADDAEIPGSYWGETEAGLQRERLFARMLTPLHSILHEAAHYVCMTPERRAGLDTDAGGDHAEENAVCYLQILLADHVDRFDRGRMMSDMDEWGYTFRLGSARAWFEQDAADARAWLQQHGLIDLHQAITWTLRD